MGNSIASQVKAAVINYDAESLQQLLQSAAVHSYDGVNLRLNSRRDCALALAIRLARYELIPVIIEAGAQVLTAINYHEKSYHVSNVQFLIVFKVLY